MEESIPRRRTGEKVVALVALLVAVLLWVAVPALGGGGASGGSAGTPATAVSGDGGSSGGGFVADPAPETTPEQQNAPDSQRDRDCPDKGGEGGSAEPSTETPV
jgi:hypothetical protein